jgi:peptidoglycan/LPS O-acetylase OafA/YrhL
MRAGERIDGRSHDPHIEGIRGYAALSVLLLHQSFFPGPGAGVEGVLSWVRRFSDGGLGVKVFFVLSGYVIGLTTSHVPPSGANVGSYLQRRLVRLFPINFFAVLLGCAVATSLDWRSVVGSLFFLENYSGYGKFYIPPPDTNGNLWTLNYEALFYLLFVLVWVMKPRPWVLFVAFLGLAVLLWRVESNWLFVSCYSCGFMFWLSGLFLSRTASVPDPHRGRVSLATVLLLVVTPKIQALDPLIHMLPWAWATPIFPGMCMKLHDLSVLPVCVVLVAEAAGRPFRGLAVLRWFAFLVALHGYFMIRGEADGLPRLFYTVMLAGALIAWKVRLPRQLLSAAACLGSISFALYATGYPIQLWVFSVHPQNTLLALAVDLVLVLAIVVGFSWFLEKRVQPWVRTLLPKPAKYS